MDRETRRGGLCGWLNAMLGSHIDVWDQLYPGLRRTVPNITVEVNILC